jgi:hypothetical protein
MNPSLAEYHVPVHMDVPEIEVVWTDIPDPHAPAGARGVGEIGITGVGAAVANAVYNATGKRVRDLPITLDKTLRAGVSCRATQVDVAAIFLTDSRNSKFDKSSCGIETESVTKRTSRAVSRLGSQ